MRHTIAIILFFFSVFTAHSATPFEMAVAEATDKKLALSPYWETLIHYKHGVISGYRSLVDDPAFFLADNGSTDAEAELIATIEALLKPDIDADSHAQCRFPARSDWLSQELPILKSSMIKASCPKYDEITAKIVPYKASIIFPSTSLAGPASMFGHTMLRLERKSTSPLLGYAVTYAANAQDANPLKYVIYGIGGGFDGHYTIMPYSEKLNEYTAIESRDIWEYELDFSEEEVRRMYDHIWEMQLVKSDYYFFDENCAYNLLFFIEAARPGVRLTDGYALSVIPIDTVRAVKEAGLVNNINYQPSHANRMDKMASTLTYSEVKLAKEIARGKKMPSVVTTMDISDNKRAVILDLAAELVLKYTTSSGVTAERLMEYRDRSYAILLTRSAIIAISDYTVAVPAVSPEQGHDSHRIGFGGGYGYSSPYAKIEWRMAYNALDDDSAGYRQGAEMSALDMDLRYYSKAERLSVDKFSLLAVMNLRPLSMLDFGVSWALDSGVRDNDLYADDEEYIAYINNGAGVTFLLADGVYLWGMFYGELQIAERYSPFVIGGIGLRGGFMASVGDWSKLIVDSRYLVYSDTSDHAESETSVKIGIYPSLNSAIVFDASYLYRYDIMAKSFGVSYRYYF